MRNSLVPVMIVSVSAMFLSAASTVHAEKAPGMELPQTGIQLEANSTATLSINASSLHRIVLHIPAGRSRIPFGSIHTRINLEAADMAAKTSIGEEGVVVDIDLDSKSGFPMVAGRNSIELEYQDIFGPEKYCNYLLDFAPGREDRQIASPATHPEARIGRLFVLVVGASHFQGGSGTPPELKYADQDAKAVMDFFKSPQGGSVREEDSEMLLNEKTMIADVRRALLKFLSRPQEQDTVVICFAGHGAPDQRDPRNFYLLTYDTKLYNMVETALPMFELQQVFAHILKARRVVTFVDARHAFGVIGERAHDSSDGKSMETNNLVNQYIEHFAGKGDRAVITASDISEKSLEDEK